MDIVAFYRGLEPDDWGRRLEEIWQWDDEQLENVHNYIQVLFPTREPSLFNARAPLLDDASIAAFREDKQLRNNLDRSFQRMLRFYGLEMGSDGTVCRMSEFAKRSANWLTPHNHNFLRITRVLKCLVTLGLQDRAEAFLECLKQIYADCGDIIGPETYGFWCAAIPPGRDSDF